jgi:hypothetical protein
MAARGSSWDRMLCVLVCVFRRAYRLFRHSLTAARGGNPKSVLSFYGMESRASTSVAQNEAARHQCQSSLLRWSIVSTKAASCLGDCTPTLTAVRLYNRDQSRSTIALRTASRSRSKVGRSRASPLSAFLIPDQADFTRRSLDGDSTSALNNVVGVILGCSDIRRGHVVC